MTESKECTCDSCVYLQTDLGQAVLEWSSAFVRECKEAVNLGLESGRTISLNMNGPTAEDLLADGSSFRGRGKVYSEMTFDIYHVAQYAPSMAETPDFDVLIEEYQDDPVLLHTLQWMKKRYG